MTETNTVSTAACRVEEFLRQWTLPRSVNVRHTVYTDSVYGIQVDRDLDYMANLYASDLRMILDELAALYDRRDTLVIERYQGTTAIADAADAALDNDGRAAGLREALEILRKVTS